MIFPLQFDLLMIGVCTFIQKQKKTKKIKIKKKGKEKRKKKDKNKTKQKTKQKKTKKKEKKEEKKKCKDMFVSHILLHQYFVVGFIIGGLSEIFMRDELCESSLRSFVPWIMDDMYWI